MLEQVKLEITKNKEGVILETLCAIQEQIVIHFLFTLLQED